MVREITTVSNTINTAVDFWVDSILQGYITEFSIELIALYSEANFFFPRTPKKIFVIYQYMDQVVYEKGIM